MHVLSVTWGLFDTIFGAVDRNFLFIPCKICDMYALQVKSKLKRKGSIVLFVKDTNRHGRDLW